ncbi:MAG TPA: ABC transporter ATP-binding protein [Steroidobacteraceae bacterium]|nr:ABC transporter ATP-binding protein [Steroidobacteraceae bacterium]
MNPVLELRHLSKSFGQFEAVRDVSLSVAEGEFLTLLGASGSGKTTTLRLIAGLEMPTSGTIHFAGADITDVPPTHRDMRLVFQDFALFPNLSVYDNVAFGLRLKISRARFPRGEIDQRVKRYVELVHLGDQLHKMPHQLSGGQKQRVALARALVTEPRVVLFDEPLGSLDASLRKAMQVEIKRMHRDLGRTFIYVTHDQDEAMTMSDKVAVMQHSQLLQLATPEEIYRHPSSAAVARFIGAANILDGEVETASAGESLIRLQGGGALRAATPPGGLGAGARVQVMMRAEHFVFDRADAGPDINWLSGRVMERLFLGRSMEYQVRIGHSQETISLLDQRQQSVPVARDGALEFGIHPGDVRVLAE